MSGRQLPLGISPRKTYSLDGYIPGQSLECLQRIKALIQDDRGGGPQFLYLYGDAGLGRSHLLQGACNAASRAGRMAIYLPLAEMSARSPADFASITTPILLALDDVHVISAMREWEVALVAAFDAVRLAGGHVLSSGRERPDQMSGMLPDLRSRLGWGEIHQLRALNEEEKLLWLQRQAGIAGLDVADEVGRYLLNRVSRDMPTLQTWLTRLDRESLAAQRRLTIPFIREILTRDAVQT